MLKIQTQKTLHKEYPWFLISQFFFARSIILLSCCCCSWGALESFEHGWSYRKNSNAGKFVFSYWFIHKNFRLIRGPVFCPVSSFCTSDGPIEKNFMQENFFWYTRSFGYKIFLMVRFSVRFPVFVLLMFFSEIIVLKRIFRLV